MNKDIIKNILIIAICTLVVLLSLLLIHHFYSKDSDKELNSTLTTNNTSSAYKHQTTLNNQTITNETIETYDRTPEKVIMKVDKSSISRTKITVIITDNNKDHYRFDVKFKIQKKVDGLWNYLGYINDNVRWIAIAYVPNDNNQVIQNIDIEKYYGSLVDGTYRIVKELSDEEHTIIYSDEFEIK